jgi:hypothetical protein
MSFIPDFFMKAITAMGQVFVSFGCHDGIDKFIQNALSDSATIRMETNAMSNVEFTTIDWGETLCKNTFETVWQIVQVVVSHQKSLTLSVFTEIGDTEPLKYVDTRYGNRVLIGRCLLDTRSIYRLS